MKFRIVLFVILLFCLGALGSHAQMDLGYDRWKLDNDRGKLEAREQELLRSYDDLKRKRDQIAGSMTLLGREQDNVDTAIRQIQKELNRIHLLLL